MVKRMLAVGCLLLSLVFLVACGGGGGGAGDMVINPTASNPASVGVVKGQITGDGDLSNIPVYLVRVDANIPPASIKADITSETNGQLNVAFTNASGEFVFNNIPYGNYNLMAKRDRNSGVIQRDITVNASTQSSVDLILKLTATGDVKGQVSVPTGFNLTGVVAFVTGTSYAAYTDASGNYIISGVPVGTYTVMFSGYGLGQTKVEIVSVGSGKTTTIPLVALAKDTLTIVQGPVGPPGPQGATGPQGLPGPQGATGTTGIGVIWKGTLSSPPTSPELNWAYYNSTDRKSYIYDGTAWQILAQDGNPIDQTGPVIASISCYGISTTKARITWTTNEDSTSQVKWDTTTTYGSMTTEDSNFTRQHSVEITGLSVGTTYHYIVVSKDSAGNVIRSGDQSFLMKYAPAVVGGTTCSGFLKSDGTVWTCGENLNGQLGDGTQATRVKLTRVFGLENVSAISDYMNGFIALKEDGTVWTWGNGKWIASQISGFSDVKAIAGGSGHLLALKSDGTVWAMGSNNEGQLGDNTTVNKSAPVQVTGITNVVAVSAGGGHSLAIKNDGTVWAWGRNNEGQLGDNTTTNRLVPVLVSSISGVSAIVGGYWHSVALKNDGTVWAWGDNSANQLGDNTTVSKLVPVQVTSLTGIVAVAGGNWHSFATKSNGTIWAWGANNIAQLGDKTTNQPLVPVQVTCVTGLVAIGVGEEHSVGAKADGTFWGWGSNNNGQLGTGYISGSGAGMDATEVRF